MRFTTQLHQLARAARIFRVNVFALRLAHLLQNHLLSGLRGDAAQGFGGLGKADLRAELSLRMGLVRVGQGGFLQRIGDFLHHLPYTENLQCASGRVDVRDQILFGMEMLARRQHHGVFNGVQDDFGFDALFLGEDLDGLNDGS